MQADLGGDGGSTFARNVAAKVENAIKQKATVEEIRNILRYDWYPNFDWCYQLYKLVVLLLLLGRLGPQIS